MVNAEGDRGTAIRLAAFDHVRRLRETRNYLFEAGFSFEGERIPPEGQVFGRPGNRQALNLPIHNID